MRRRIAGGNVVGVATTYSAPSTPEEELIRLACPDWASSDGLCAESDWSVLAGCSVFPLSKPVMGRFFDGTSISVLSLGSSCSGSKEAFLVTHEDHPDALYPVLILAAEARDRFWLIEGQSLPYLEVGSGRGGNCVVAPRQEGKDVLLCLTYDSGQGYIESNLIEIEFIPAEEHSVVVQHSFLLRASSDAGYYGQEVIDCSAPGKTISLDDMELFADHVTVHATVADSEAIAASCLNPASRGELYHELPPGHAVLSGSPSRVILQVPLAGPS